MNKQALLHEITESVRKKHPWRISQEKYKNLFGELPSEFLIERQIYDNLLEKAAQFKLCQLVLSQVKIQIKLNLDELIIWELSLDKWEEAKSHNILPGDIKKLLKETKNIIRLWYSGRAVNSKFTDISSNLIWRAIKAISLLL